MMTNTSFTKLEKDSVKLVGFMMNSIVQSNADMVRELATNALRAGASKIIITTGYANNTPFLSIEDDGCGISDFNKLINPGESTWENPVFSGPTPGFGFFGCMSCSDFIKVQSNGKVFSARRINLFSGDSFPISDAHGDDIVKNGTKITLTGAPLLFTEISETRFSQIFCGFPIPVVVNGKEINRPYSKYNADLEFIDHEDTSLCINMKKNDSGGYGDFLSIPQDTIIFFGGLIVALVSPFGKSKNITNITDQSTVKIIHLDEKRFSVSPLSFFRDLDGNQIMDILNFMNGLIKRELSSRHKAGSFSRELLLNSFNLFSDYGLASLYNDIDAIPASVLLRFNGSPIIPENECEHIPNPPTPPHHHPSRKDIDDKVFPIYGENPAKSRDFTKATYCWRKQGFFMSGNAKSLDSNHWIFSCLSDNSDISVVLDNHHFSNHSPNGIDKEFIFCDSYTMTGPCGDVVVNDAAYFDGETIVFPQNNHYPSVLLQLKVYENDFSDFDYESYESDSIELDQWLILSREKDHIAESLELFLRQKLDGVFHHHPKFLNKSFSININNLGEISVSLIANQSD